MGRSVADIRRDRLAALWWVVWGLALRRGGPLVIRVIRATWRHLLPVYWGIAAGAAALLIAALRVPLPITVLAVVCLAGALSAWPASSAWVRAYRITVGVYLGCWAMLAGAAGRVPPVLMASLIWSPLALGWPWWWHLSASVTRRDGRVDHALTKKWSTLWQVKIVDSGVLKNVELHSATRPRENVVEATLHLTGGTIAGVMDKRPEIETALGLDEGSVGFSRTGKASRLAISFVERSYITSPIPWRTTYRDGRFTSAIHADGSVSHWVCSRPGSGVSHGLVVGATEGGKSKTLSGVIRNHLDAGFRVAVGDTQNGQSLPQWDGIVEYHSGADETLALLEQGYAEVMARSSLLAERGIDHFDVDNPAIRDLGLSPIAIVCDEIQILLSSPTLAIRRRATFLAEQIASLGRKTGVALVFATHTPHLAALGGSLVLRGSLVTGNCVILRLTSSKSAGQLILPDGFIGDPFSIPKEIEVNGKMVPAAGFCYTGNSRHAGMMARVPLVSDRDIADAPRVPVVWLTPTPGGAVAAPGRGDDRVAKRDPQFEEMIRMFDGPSAASPAPKPNVKPRRQGDAAKKWIIDQLRAGKQSAGALKSHPACPVSQTQLYTHLKALEEADLIKKVNGVYELT